MPNELPSWDDVLAGTPLNMGGILDAIRKALAKLPPDAGGDAVDAAVTDAVGQAFTLENLTNAKASVIPAVKAFVLAGGVGPVEKSATDLL